MTDFGITWLQSSEIRKHVLIVAMKEISEEKIYRKNRKLCESQPE